jgi:hypothetical protein
VGVRINRFDQLGQLVQRLRAASTRNPFLQDELILQT